MTDVRQKIHSFSYKSKLFEAAEKTNIYLESLIPDEQEVIYTFQDILLVNDPNYCSFAANQLFSDAENLYLLQNLITKSPGISNEVYLYNNLSAKELLNAIILQQFNYFNDF